MNRLTRLMNLLRQQHGNRCAICGEPHALEFAHVTPTGLNGRGRGGLVRAYDIQRNPDAYRLLCRSCHLRYDAFLRSARALRTRVHNHWYLGQHIGD